MHFYQSVLHPSVHNAGLTSFTNAAPPPARTLNSKLEFTMNGQPASQEERLSTLPATLGNRNSTGDEWLDGVFESLLLGARKASKSTVDIQHRSFGRFRLHWPKTMVVERDLFWKFDIESGIFYVGTDGQWTETVTIPHKQQLGALIRQYCMWQGQQPEPFKRSLIKQEAALKIISADGIKSPSSKSFRWNNITIVFEKKPPDASEVRFRVAVGSSFRFQNIPHKKSSASMALRVQAQRASNGIDNIAIVFDKKWLDASGVRFRIVLGKTSAKDKIMLKRPPKGKWEAIPFSKTTKKFCVSIRQSLDMEP
ncbi:unnamed protein product [Sympodiomycopsis kandeliae]